VTTTDARVRPEPAGSSQAGVDGQATDRPPEPSSTGTRSTALLWLLTLGLWAVSLPRIETAAIGRFGLLSAFPVTMYLAFVTIAIATVRAIQHRERATVLAAHVALFLVMMHGTPALLYDTLRYSWAWKHLGVVDYLARHHEVDPSLRNVEIYQSWPGFFTFATTWLSGSGLRSWTGAAQWSPLFWQALNALAVYALMESFERDRRVVWYGVWFFVLGNWIGQDYFAPQAMAYFLYLVVVVVVVRWLVRRPPMPRALTRLVRASSSARRASVHADSKRRHAEARAAVLVIVLCVGAVASSHPLTPFALVAALVLLAAARVLTVRELPLVAAGITVLWLMTGARSFVGDNLGDFVSDVGNLGGSVDQSLSKATNATDAQQLVSTVGRIGIVVLILTAVVAFLRHVRSGRWYAIPALLAVAPVAILFGSSYGGEAGFRVYLFALPFLAFFAATVCVPARGERTQWEPILAFGLSGLLLLAFAFGYFGKEQWTHFETGEVRAAEIMYDLARPGTLVVQGTSDYPIGFAKLEAITYLDLSREPAPSSQRVIDDPVGRLTRWLSDPRYTKTFVIITDAQKAQTAALGLLPVGALDRIERALLASPQFTALYKDEHASLFVLAPRPGTRTR
jgi:hypothetical protein